MFLPINNLSSNILHRSPRSRGSTHRSPANPLGRKDSKVTQEANTMVARVMILLLIGAAKKCWSILEQPLTSCMEHHPSFQKTLALINLVKLSIRMCDFGGETPKPTLLYSSRFECNWTRFYFFHMFTLVKRNEHQRF